MEHVAIDAVASRSAGAARADAFRRLADEHLDASYRLARAILHDPAEAEDATHDAFVTAWRKWSSLRDSSRFEAWFQRILVNTCRNRLRRNARRRVHDISDRILADVADAAPSVDDRELVRSVLGTLGPDDRAILTLRYYRDLPIDQIAAVVGIPAGTVKSRLHRTLRRLQVVLEEALRPEARR